MPVYRLCESLSPPLKQSFKPLQIDSNMKETANKEAFDKFEASQSVKPPPATVDENDISARYDCLLIIVIIIIIIIIIMFVMLPIGLTSMLSYLNLRLRLKNIFIRIFNDL